ncbi:MAG: hypothetical protein HFH38_03360 [Lachnospiraceae bacterium]|jgi:hypothetical protein|nr:hypothetical protein [Lachnospiraceae bacterium]
MATIEIVLLVIGVIMMVASFFIAEKLSNGDLDKIAELSTEEMQRILERNLNEAQTKVNAMVDQVIDQSIEKSMEVVDRALDKETNEKMKAITEYSDTVLEAIHKTHNEVMFLYSMLNDKHAELTNYAGNLAQLAIHLEELQDNIQKTVQNSDEILRQVQDAPAPAPEPAANEGAGKGQDTGDFAPLFGDGQERTGNNNQRILAMYQDGKDAVEIARELGLGVGEVRLVIGLFREEEV